MDNLCVAYVPSRKRHRNFYKFLDFFSCSWLKFSQVRSTLNSNNDNRRQIKMVPLPLSINPRMKWKEQGRIIFLCINIRDELQIKHLLLFCSVFLYVVLSQLWFRFKTFLTYSTLELLTAKKVEFHRYSLRSIHKLHIRDYKWGAIP